MEREELHQRIELLREKLKEGRIKVAPHLADDFWASLEKVTIAPDGLVDPDTVDGRVRSFCMFIAHEHGRRQWKEAVSLREIQEGYFQRVTYAFGQLYEMMTKAQADPYRFADWFSSEEQRVQESQPVIEEFLGEIWEFWENISDPTWIHLEDSINSKAVFTGELFPDGRQNIASSTGIYFDTTILPDPFIKIWPMLQYMERNEKCCEIIRLALQTLGYKELALAELDNPIVAILPDRHNLEDEYKEFVHQCAVSDSIDHTKVLFGQALKDNEELFDFYSKFSDADHVVKSLVHPDKLIFATEWEGSLSHQINRLLEEQGSKFGLTKAGQAVYLNLISRFSQANDAFQRSCQLNGTPIIKAETSWIWYNQMMEYNSGNSAEDRVNDLHIARALNSTVQNEMPWMGNIPQESLIEMRKVGALDEVRQILAKGLKDIIEANPDNFYRTGDQVFDNLYHAFQEHKKRIEDLASKKWKFAGRDIGSFVVVGSIEITAAVTGLPLYGALGAMAGMTGAIPNVKDLKEKYRRLKANESEINNTGVGILLKSKNV